MKFASLEQGNERVITEKAFYQHINGNVIATEENGNIRFSLNDNNKNDIEILHISKNEKDRINNDNPSFESIKIKSGNTTIFEAANSRGVIINESLSVNADSTFKNILVNTLKFKDKDEEGAETGTNSTLETIKDNDKINILFNDKKLATEKYTEEYTEEYTKKYENDNNILELKTIKESDFDENGELTIKLKDYPVINFKLSKLTNIIYESADKNFNFEFLENSFGEQTEIENKVITREIWFDTHVSNEYLYNNKLSIKLPTDWKWLEYGEIVNKPQEYFEPNKVYHVVARSEGYTETIEVEEEKEVTETNIVDGEEVTETKTVTEIVQKEIIPIIANISYIS